MSRRASSSRSKSPAAKKKGGLDPMDYKDDAIALALCLGLAYLSKIDLGPESVGKLMLGGGEDLPVIGQSAVLTLHTLNTCQGRGRKFWLTDLMECVASVFAAGIALELLNGKRTIGDALMAGTEAQYTFVALCWYLQNHSIAGVVPNVWDMVTSSPVGPALQKVMTLATTCFVNSIIITAATSVEAENPSGVAITPLIKATLVAGATSAIPSKPLNTAATASALTIAVLVSTSGLTSLPMIGETVTTVTKTVTTAVPFIGTEIGDIYTNLTIGSFFLGGILSTVGVPSEILAPGAFVAGLINKVLNVQA
jgi:hypothetical protein